MAKSLTPGIQAVQAGMKAECIIAEGGALTAIVSVQGSRSPSQTSGDHLTTKSPVMPLANSRRDCLRAVPREESPCLHLMQLRACHSRCRCRPQSPMMRAAPCSHMTKASQATCKMDAAVSLLVSLLGKSRRLR